ncbi:MAG: cytochrome c [Actinobacteria bacterium]|nr:cytochrome c [Actinomycetota bacterium]
MSVSLLAFSGQTLASFAAVGVVLIVVAVMTARRMRTRTVAPDIPEAMAPGPSDADLEKPLLEKLQAWMLLLVLFFAIWIPVYWLLEPSQNVSDELHSNREGIQRGRETTEEFEEGVNELGFGCVRCHGDGLTGGLNFFEGKFVKPPSLVDVCGRLTLEQVYETIREGRPDTDMPSWSVRFAGPLDDQQISDIVQYLLSIQTVPDDQNKCINPPTEEAG